MNKQRYIHEDSRKCPFCDGADLATLTNEYYKEGDFVSCPPRISTAMCCENCGKEWFDIYQLVDIQSISGEEDNQLAEF